MSAPQITVPDELFAPAGSLSFDGSYELDTLLSGPDLYDFPKPLTWHVMVSNTGDALLVSGTVEGTGRTSCSRCLEPFELSIMGEVEGYYILDEDAKPEDMEPDEYQVLPEDNVIDLEPILRSAIIMDLPLVPLCDEDCKGLCPYCGINLNKETCDCAKEHAHDELTDPVSNPFAALASLDLSDSESSSDDDSKSDGDSSADRS
jgi:uncharacterized protein